MYETANYELRVYSRDRALAVIGYFDRPLSFSQMPIILPRSTVFSQRSLSMSARFMS